MRSIPLHDDEAEQAALGSVMVGPEVLDRIAYLITSGDYYLEAHGRICQIMLDLQGRGKPVDLVDVSALLKERVQLKVVVGEVFLVGFSEEVEFATNGAYYANILRKKSMNGQFYSPLGVAR